ncbi:prepilin-type N-terminal cleavage/methylation domain-containing protein [Pelomonas sp. KK5]|uniref:prepilin-type N-terminal cleavage/methylation domain-containing protein n=1 Tax=Pelomonas sp. KK5 TaxID=1855730 RepID=UPI001301CEE1|nr:prepilin-type N-terminal cleavage/methylation domain-containing protein [Pelomonas sp. KK5]
MRPGRGFTLLEAAIVVAVIAIVAAVAIPSYNNYRQRRELQQVAEALTQDLRSARELSVSAGQPILVSFRTGGGKWCWGMAYATACDCLTGIPACKIRAVGNDDYRDVSMTDATEIEITAKLAQVARSGGASFRNRLGQDLRVQMSLLGHVATCGPASPGAKSC